METRRVMEKSATATMPLMAVCTELVDAAVADQLARRAELSAEEMKRQVALDVDRETVAVDSVGEAVQPLEQTVDEARVVGAWEMVVVPQESGWEAELLVAVPRQEAGKVEAGEVEAGKAEAEKAEAVDKVAAVVVEMADLAMVVAVAVLAQVDRAELREATVALGALVVAAKAVQ